MTKKTASDLLFLVASVIVVVFVAKIYNNQNTLVQPVVVADKTIPVVVETHQGVSESTSVFTAPLERAAERVMKKPFGILISLKTSPVQPDRFSGYHTGTDFETFPEEALVGVSVQAICDGVLIAKRTASGYGGVVVESCLLENSPITVVYGHVNLTSITARVGDTVKQGQILGNLGEGYSPETDGERKHLHLGIHKGAPVNILGYVSKKSALIDFVDPCLYICER